MQALNGGAAFRLCKTNEHLLPPIAAAFPAPGLLLAPTVGLAGGTTLAHSPAGSSACRMEYGGARVRVTIAASFALALTIAAGGTAWAAAARVTTVRIVQLKAAPSDGSAAPRATTAHEPGPRSARHSGGGHDVIPAIVGASLSRTPVGRVPDGRHRRCSSESAQNVALTGHARGDAVQALARIGQLARGGALVHEANAPPVLSSYPVDGNHS